MFTLRIAALPLLLFSTIALAQNDPKNLPIVIPASPEVSSLVNAELLSNDLHTGAATANINLFTIQNGSLTFPISLSYRSNGIKVNDIASRVGIGWSISNQGVISRSIRDVDDFKTTRVWQTTPDFTPYEGNEALYNYLNQADAVSNDTEHDLYSFAFNGYSGEFYIEENGTIRQLNHSNLLITKQGTSSFTIRTPDGTQYFFGGSQQLVEKTKSYNSNGSGAHTAAVLTAWFLYRILSQEGNEILLTYNDLEVYTMNGYHQSVILRQIAGGDNASCPACDSTYCPESFPLPSQNLTDYYSKYLTQISCSNGVKVEFTYESRADLSNDNRVKTMSVSYNGSQGYQVVKSYQFNYNTYQTGSFIKNKRFFLTNIQELGSGNILPIQHDFEYEDPAGLPDQYSLSQDYFGYANGALNISHFFPKPPTFTQFVNASLGADRNPNELYAKKGSLKKIKYPTGGYQEYIYEGHTLPEWVTQTTYSSIGSMFKAGVSGTNSSNPVSLINSFSTNSAGEFKIDLYTFINPQGPQPGQFGFFQEDGLHPLAKIEVFQYGPTGAAIGSSTLTSYNASTSFLVNGLLPNTSYSIKLTVYWWSVSASAGISVPVTTSFWQNQPACGVRVKQINSLENLNAIPIVKIYKYAALDNLQKSSGIGVRISDYQGLNPQGGICSWATLPSCGSPLVSEVVECNTLRQFSSSSLSPMPTFNGSCVGYTDIIVCEDEQMNKGGVQNTFIASVGNLSQQMIGNYITGANYEQGGTIPDGTMIGQKVFKKMGGNFSIIKEIINEYSVDSRKYNSLSNYMVRKRYAPYWYGTSNYSLADILKPFDAAKYDYVSFWHHLDKETTKTWFENDTAPLVTETSYEYGNEDHTLPTRIVTKNSKGETIEQLMTYPANYATIAPYQSMISKGIINPVIEVIKNKIVGSITTPLEKVKTNYVSVGSLEKPSNVQVSTGANSLETRIDFNQYNSIGRIVEQQKTNDVKEVYLWGYRNNYPVAKIVNTTFGAASAAINPNILDIPADDQTFRNQLDVLRGINGTLVTTYTYKPLVGITSETDPNGRTIYYEYDGLGRLVLIRDQDSKILKKICYNYAGQQEDCLSPCTTTSADWQNTTTPPACQQGSCGNTGYQLQEQRDMNPCSPTYNQTQTVQVSNPTACPGSTPVNITYQNNSGESGFTAVYTNTSTSQTYSFNIPANGSGTLGCVPAGTYSLTISKTPSGFPPILLFGSGCQYFSGEFSATFSNTNIVSCHHITLDWDF